MSRTIPVTDLSSRYKEISDYCHSKKEAVYISLEGIEGLAVISASYYLELSHKIKKYQEILTGLKEEDDGIAVNARKLYAR